MDEPIFKPCGNPVGPIMEINFSKPNYFIQSWVGTFSEFPQWALHVFWAHQKGPQAFFLQSPVRVNEAQFSGGFAPGPNCSNCQSILAHLGSIAKILKEVAYWILF